MVKWYHQMELIHLQMMKFNNHKLIKYGIKLNQKQMYLFRCVYFLSWHRKSRLSSFFFACMYMCVCPTVFFFLEYTRAIIVIYTYKYLFFVFVVNDQHTQTYTKANIGVLLYSYPCVFKNFLVERLCNK
jgi:hypothetical protein